MIKCRSEKELVMYLKAKGIIKTPEVEEAMSTLDRAKFIRSMNIEEAYLDRPYPIGCDATISAPHMHAICLELLRDQLHTATSALDIGSGSGYFTGAMALMSKKKAKVIGVESQGALVHDSLKNLQETLPELLKNKLIEIHEGDGRAGYLPNAPYDVIHVGAAAAEIPPALIEQLNFGGRLVIPVGDRNTGQDLMVIDKNADGSLTKSIKGFVFYVPLL